MKFVLVMLVTWVLTACVANSPKQTLYISEEKTIDKLLSIMLLENLGVDITQGLFNEANPQTKAELKKAFDQNIVQAEFREYLLMNLPQANAQAWVEYFSSDFQQRIIHLEDQYKNPEIDPSSADYIENIKRDPAALARLNTLKDSVKWENRLHAIYYDGLLKPTIYGAALLSAKGQVLDQAVLEKHVVQQLNAIWPSVIEVANDSFYYVYGHLSAADYDTLLDYYHSPIATYVDDTLAGAISHSLANASKRFIDAVQQKTQAMIQASVFDKESCLKVRPHHVCEVLNVASIGTARSLFIGSAVLPKSKQYRVMSPNSDWQKIKLSNRYADDLIMTRKDGLAVFSTQFRENEKVDVQAYKTTTLGELADAIKVEPEKVSLPAFDKLTNSALYELCYNYYGVDVCKITGGADLEGGALYVDAFYLRSDAQINEVVNILISFEETVPLAVK